MFGQLSDNEIENVLRSQLVGRIGCCSDGVPYVVPTSYAYENDTIYCHTHEGMKVSIMRKNPLVCFEVDEMAQMSRWKSVIAWGRYTEITDGVARVQALKILLKRNLPILSSETVHLTSTWPFEPEDISRIPGVVYSISIDKKTGRFEDDQESPFFAG